MVYINFDVCYNTLAQYTIFAGGNGIVGPGGAIINNATNPLGVANGYYGYTSGGSTSGTFNPSGSPSGLNTALAPSATTDLTNFQSDLYSLAAGANYGTIPHPSFNTSQTGGTITFNGNNYYGQPSSGSGISYSDLEVIFDANGDSTAQFFLDSSGNISFNNCTFTLANGALANNIFINANASITIATNAASTRLYGIFKSMGGLTGLNFQINGGVVKLQGRLYGQYNALIQANGNGGTLNVDPDGFPPDPVPPGPEPGPEPVPGPTPISNVCFAGNTPISTDQGSVLIKNIKPSVHTIHNEAIVAVTRSTSIDRYLVCFEKDSLGEGIPSEQTIMSKDHKILYMGELIKARQFVEMFENVRKVKYNGEILYNIVMKNYRKISVNNMVCETLHPKNIIAKLYSSMFYENKIMAIEELNGYILANDSFGYSKAVRKIGK
jgi:hypothetical protein